MESYTFNELSTCIYRDEETYLVRQDIFSPVGRIHNERDALNRLLGFKPLYRINVKLKKPMSERDYMRYAHKWNTGEARIY